MSFGPENGSSDRKTLFCRLLQFVVLGNGWPGEEAPTSLVFSG
jgi:hypothetical protein